MSTVEDLRHALEQLAQQLLLGQVGERGVGDPLQRLEPAGGRLRRLARARAREEQAGLLDGERGAVGGELEQLALVGCELARCEAADVQYADHAALDDAAGRRAGSGCPSRAGSG